MGKGDNKKRVTNTAQEQAAGMLGLMGRFARQLPGAEFAEEQLNHLEARAMRELKQRLEAVDDRRLPKPANYHPPKSQVNGQDAAPVQVVQVSPLGQHPQDVLAELLDRAAEQDQAQARLYLYSMILRELVPDEARILGALSEGDVQPLIHVGVGAPIGGVRRVAENFSTIGKTANVKLREFTPIYITHLRNLDLLETGPEDKQFEIQYQILESDRDTKPAVEEAQRSSGPGTSVKFVRRVIRMSPLGRELWDTCQAGIPEEE